MMGFSFLLYHVFPCISVMLQTFCYFVTGLRMSHILVPMRKTVAFLLCPLKRCSGFHSKGVSANGTAGLIRLFGVSFWSKVLGITELCFKITCICGSLPLISNLRRCR